MSQDSQTPLQDISRQGTPKVTWDTKNMKSSYANVCNVASTREEVVVMFGLSQAWSGSEEEVAVALNDRIILSPYAAKRLALLLSNVVQQYEQRFGSLDSVQPASSAAKS